MKIYFHQREDNVYVIGTDKTDTVWWDACLYDPSNRLQLSDLRQLMREKFASIDFENEIRFKITDKSDEAFFLVWSSEVIEI